MKALSYIPLILMLLFGVSAADAANKSAERVVGGSSAAERASEMARLHADLESSVPAQLTVHRVDLTAEEFDILADPRVDDTGLFRVGLSKNVHLQLSAADGDLEIRGAANTMRLNIQVVSGIVYAWDRSGTAHSYTQSGWTHSLQAPVSVRVTGAAIVTEVGLITLAGSGGFCPYNASCVENAECASIPATINAARDAVGHMLFAQGAWYYICSGALIADSDPNTEIPYFLTANHCLSRDKVADSLEVFFQYTIPCGETCGDYEIPTSYPSTLGATVVATGKSGDYTLLLLDEAPPSGSVFLGWDTAPVAWSEGTNLYRISHPGGAPQAYSEHSVDTSAGTCRSWPRGERIYSRDTLGATEGGSSGAVVMNSTGDIVGQLSGACGFNLDDVCDAVSNATVDGAFAAYYDEIAAILGGGDGTCTDEDNDGYCVEDGDCDDTDRHVHPGHQDSNGRWGRDGVDNDCNGIIDG